MRFTARLAPVVFLIGTLGCGSDLVLPDSPGSAAQNVALTKVTGDAQTGPVGEPLDTALVVRVLNEEQLPVDGLEVAFELSDPAGGTVDPVTATTNSAGEAVASWTLGTVPGTHTVSARLVGIVGENKIAQFQAVATPAAPDTLSPGSPLDQPGRKEQPVATPPAVRVVDRFGNPVPDVPVNWQVTAGEGEVTTPTNTDALGIATAQWTLGNRSGYHKLTATVESAVGSPVTFTAYVLF